MLLLFVGVGCGIFGGGGGDSTPPPVPSGLQATSGDAEVVLQWGGVNADDLEGYNVYRSASSLPVDSVSSQSPLNENPQDDPAFTDRTVQNGTVYVYRVTSVDGSGNESDPSGGTKIRPFSGPPDRP